MGNIYRNENGLIELKSRVPEGSPERIYVYIVNMFRTRKEPRSHQSILKEVTILEALEKSASNERWEEVIPV